MLDMRGCVESSYGCYGGSKVGVRRMISSSVHLTHQLHRRRCTANRKPTNVMPMGAKNMFAWLLGLWAIHSYQCSPLFGIRDHRHRSPLMAQAFSDVHGWSSSRRHHSSRSLAAKHGAMHLERALSLSDSRLIYPAFHPCRGLSPLQVPCRKNNVFLGGRAPPKTDAKCDGRSLVVCQSTISDETAEATAEEVDIVQQISVNGMNGANGHSNNISISIYDDTSNSQQLDNNTDASLDIPTPTVNGGYTHTSTSRAKISAANKGKTPWNKGKARSEETKARIAEGVRRRNRERFLAKLAEEGITEEEYNERKKAERRKKDAERRARKTAKGGYTPTEETKKKISKILKEKYANGEVTRKPRDPTKVRRGFKHSEETKQKIRESLRRKWAEDSEYRELMTNKTVASGNVDASIRQRISETLKKRWQDPEFRSKMMDKFSKRKLSSGRRNDSHRQKISAAMKKKWMDEEYRRRATEGMAKGRERDFGKVQMAKPVQPRMPKRGVARSVGSVQSLEPLSPVKAIASMKKTKSPSTKVKKKTKKKTVTKKKSSTSSGAFAVKAVEPIAPSSTPSKPEKKAPNEEEELQDDGCISRLREERRDLYDLLYGDEEEDGGHDVETGVKNGRGVNGESNSMLSSSMMAGVSSNTMAALLGDDDDLDDFDPYGLHDTAPSSAYKRA